MVGLLRAAVDVEVSVTAFVSKIARRAVLTRVEVHEGGQIGIHRVSAPFVTNYKPRLRASG